MQDEKARQLKNSWDETNGRRQAEFRITGIAGSTGAAPTAATCANIQMKIHSGDTFVCEFGKIKRENVGRKPVQGRLSDARQPLRRWATKSAKQSKIGWMTKKAYSSTGT